METDEQAGDVEFMPHVIILDVFGLQKGLITQCSVLSVARMLSLDEDDTFTDQRLARSAILSSCCCVAPELDSRVHCLNTFHH